VSRIGLSLTLAALAVGGCEVTPKQQPAYGASQSSSKTTEGAGNAPDTRRGAGAYGSDETSAYGSPGVGGESRTTAGKDERRDALDATGGAEPTRRVQRATTAAPAGGSACSRLERCYARMSRDVCAHDDRSCMGDFDTSSLPVDEASCRSILSTMGERARVFLTKREGTTLPGECRVGR
jgi:hypothetical protein